MTSASASRLLLTLLLLLAAMLAGAQVSPPVERALLRGYREIRHAVEIRGTPAQPVALHRFVLADSAHAVIFASKLFSDFELTTGNRVIARGGVDVIDLGGQGILAPLLSPKSSEVLVLAGSADAVTAEIRLLAKTPVLRRTDLTHPLYLDKWDRYSLGVWQSTGDYAKDTVRPDLNAFYKWMGEVGLNPQVNQGTNTIDMVPNDNTTTWLRKYFTAYGVKYQRTEWLTHQPDLYNRNPFLAKTINPHAAARWNYYGEIREGVHPLRDMQTANFLAGFRRLAGDPNQMAVLDPDGEIGPFDASFWGASGPVMQREFTRFLREVRRLTLDDVSRRYYGKPGQLKSWEAVTLADWRTFYGWTAGAVDLAGEWRFMRDTRLEGYGKGWAQSAFNDEDWLRLYYPGDALVYSLAASNQPLWMRKTITLDPKAFPGRIYLSLAPLSAASVQVFLNGRPLGALDPHFHTANTYGQFDITADVTKSRILTVALRFAGDDVPNGPVFITPKPLERFPTADPLLNARRWDHLEFVDWATAQGVGSTLRAIRAVDPDRPIKVHAYGSSPWGWKTVAAYGGYSHHTGSGAGWHYTEPKQHGAARNLQDSSEPGGPMSNLRDLKGLFGNLIYMGKNAHDYFINLQSITRDPQMRAHFEAKMPAIKVMGRAHIVISPIGVMNGLLNAQYQGEFARWEIWRYGQHPARGGELVPYLDEVRLREGNLGAFKAIIDPGTECWDAEMTDALRAYVEAGGVLVLNNLSGISSFLTPDSDTGPGPALAGVRWASVPQDGRAITITQTDPRIYATAGKINLDTRYGVPNRGLAPQVGVEVIGTWSDDSPALTRRALGKGFVYYCGGSTYPRDPANAFANTYGPAVYASATGGFDLLRTLRGNNGCEDLLMVRGLGDKPATVRWTFDYVPTAIYDPVTGTAIPATIEGNTATFTVTIPDWDFSWFAARRPSAAANLTHWYNRQTQIWSGYTPDAKAPDAPVYRLLDLNHDWKLVQTTSVDAAKTLMPRDDAAAGLLPTELVPWDTPGINLKTGKDVVGFYRRDFTLPAFWGRDSQLTLAIRGQIHDCPVHGFLGKSGIYLNGSVIWEGEKLDTAYLDVTKLLVSGRNRLEIIHQGNGIMPSIVLRRTATPDAVIDLAGPWRALTGLQSETAVTLPGDTQAAAVYTDITVPASAKGQEIWLRVDGPCPYVIINGRLRYWDMWLRGEYAMPTVYEVDITPDIRIGAPNRIVLGSGGLFNGWSPVPLSYKHVELALYRPGKWSADGKGTRDALTPKELADVARDLGTIQTYPLVHAAVEKPVPALLPPGAENTPLALPATILDLDLHPADGVAVDRGPNKVPVTVKGGVESFTEAGGRITGVYLRGESTAPGTLLLAPTAFRKQMEGKSATFRAWVKPMAINNGGGTLFCWIDYNLNWDIVETRSAFNLNEPPTRRLIAETVIRQRAWQCLTMVVEGNQATLYVDAVPVATQQWVTPIRGTDTPLTIGSAVGTRNFLNAKLAAFSVYAGALSREDVARQYLQERGRYQETAPTSWLENDVFRLAAGENRPVDQAEIPVKIESANGVTIKRDEAVPYLSFSGQRSSLLMRDHPRARHFAGPFSLVWEMRREENAEGTILRHHHIICLNMLKDGSLTFDTNIGKRNLVTFPKVVPAGKWVRLMLTYDRQTVRLFRDGELMAERPYVGSLVGSDYPLVIFSDNTHPRFPDYACIRGDLREFRIIPGILPAMPPPSYQ